MDGGGGEKEGLHKTVSKGRIILFGGGGLTTKNEERIESVQHKDTHLGKPGGILLLSVAIGRITVCAMCGDIVSIRRDNDKKERKNTGDL